MDVNWGDFELEVEEGSQKDLESTPVLRGDGFVGDPNK